MSVRLEDEIIYLSGDCRVEDAEAFLAALQARPDRTVDLSAAVRLHAAVAQVLLAFRPQLAGPAGDLFLETWLMPLLARPSVGKAQRE